MRYHYNVLIYTFYMWKQKVNCYLGKHRWFCCQSGNYRERTCSDCKQRQFIGEHNEWIIIPTNEQARITKAVLEQL